MSFFLKPLVTGALLLTSAMFTYASAQPDATAIIKNVKDRDQGPVSYTHLTLPTILLV